MIRLLFAWLLTLFALCLQVVVIVISIGSFKTTQEVINHTLHQVSMVTVQQPYQI
jgi:hypothetical protein